MKKILFQGDSITDCGRSREFWFNLGQGYVTVTAAELGYKYPGEYEFINRGVGGDRITHLLTRVNCDMINIKPDYMSILIGVNDVWAKWPNNDNVEADLFEIYYNMLIEQLKAKLPDTKIMILEPFVLKGSATRDEWEYFRVEVEKRAAASRRVAEKNELTFIPLMDKFDEAAKLAPPEYWTADGVHPTAMGHEIIAKEWVKAFELIKQE